VAVAAGDTLELVDMATGKAVRNFGRKFGPTFALASSRDGKYLAAAVDASVTGQSEWVTEVTAAAPPTPLVTDIADTRGHGFATISPDDTYLAAAWGGRLWLVDRATGNYVADVDVGGDATQPDWSPDDSQLVFATGKDDAPAGASIATVAHTAGSTFGAVTTLVPAAGQTNLFPSFSPDGRWIAYSRGQGGHDDPKAQLWVVGKDGGTPVELIAANRVVNNTTTDGLHQNSLPTWAPSGDLYWVAFNSMRTYGVVRDNGDQQIWVAAIDPAKLAAGGADPSFPAFRLQFQGLDEDNHRAYWVEDVRDPEPVCVDAGSTCVPGQDLCCGTAFECTPTVDADYRCVSQID
jgi:hypothetical protein